MAHELAPYDYYYRTRCSPPWAPKYPHGQAVGNAVPTCLWCIVDMRYS